MRKSPAKLRAKQALSPKRQSPLQKSKTNRPGPQGIINLKSTPSKFAQINEIFADGEDFFDH